MRLIDADELRKKSFKDDGEELLSINSLVGEPTVKAIPISVLEDIKAEIQLYIDAPNLSNKNGVEDGLRLAKNIIDKHISEKEQELHLKRK